MFVFVEGYRITRNNIFRKERSKFLLRDSSISVVINHSLPPNNCVESGLCDAATESKMVWKESIFDLKAITIKIMREKPTASPQIVQRTLEKTQLKYFFKSFVFLLVSHELFVRTSL